MISVHPSPFGQFSKSDLTPRRLQGFTPNMVLHNRTPWVSILSHGHPWLGWFGGTMLLGKLHTPMIFHKLVNKALHLFATERNGSWARSQHWSLVTEVSTFYRMWVKQCHNAICTIAQSSPFCRCYVYHSQSWMVYFPLFEQHLIP